MSIPALPFDIIRYQEVESTNSIALELGEQGAQNGTVVQALTQREGKGRQARVFLSPVGGLYISVILRPTLLTDTLPLVTLAAGVAAAEIIEIFSNLRVQLKWPNDLYVNDRKLGGILTESAPYSIETGTIPFIVTGIGVNVNTPIEAFPETLREMVTSLYCQSGQHYDIAELLQSLVRQLLQDVENLSVDEKTVLARWQRRDYLLNKQLRWQTPKGETVQGVGKGLLPDGRYRLTTVDGNDYSVLSGDIILTEIDGKRIK